MEEIILPALRSHVPGVSENTGKPTWHLPIHIYNKDGIDLDFGPLLLFDKGVIDSQSLEYILSNKRPELSPLAKSITILRDEGYIETRDFGSELSKVRKTITQHVEKIIDNPLPLREPVLRGIDGYRSNFSTLKTVYKDFDPSLLSLGFGMHLHLMSKFGQINEIEKVRLDNLMESNKKRWRGDELEDVKSIIRPTITYLYQNMALSEIYGAPFLDVEYTSELYNILREESISIFNNKSNIVANKVREGKKLFDCVIPQLRPSSPKKMLALLKQKSIKDFRDYVSQAATDGRSITKDEYISLLTDTLKAEHKLGEIKEKIVWGERLISLFPAVHLISMGLGAILDKVVQRKMTKNKWLYALIESANSKEH